MILYLHGAGERGDDLEKVKAHGPPKMIENGKSFPFIIVSPQCPDVPHWWGGRADFDIQYKLVDEVDTLNSLLDEVIENHAVDTERIYLTGLSMGGYGTFALACERPDRFAAIAPICGGGDTEKARNLKDVPVWAFHGAKDDVIALRKSEEMVNAINACGGNAKLTVYPDARHDSWTVTYDNPQLYEWLLSHRKK